MAAMLALVVAGPASAATLYTVTPGNQLVSFDSADPNSTSSPLQVTGLQGTNERILGIDVRPATGQLYALGNTNRLYTINLATGAATPVGSPGQFTLSGDYFGIDFNPVTDQVRVVSETDQNLLLNPNTGTPVGSQPNVFFSTTPGAPNPNVVGSAYNNNFPGALTSTLFAIDSELDALLLQNQTSGQLVPRGPLDVNPDDLLGFDIAPDGTAYFIAGFPGGSFFHILNLTTGQATSVGGPMSQPNLDGLAVVPDPATPGGGDGTGSTGGGGTPPGSVFVPPGADLLLGDYNNDGKVDAADYVVWRKGQITEDYLQARQRAVGGYVPGDSVELYSEWRANFGRVSSSQRRRPRRILFARGRVTLRGGQSKLVRTPLTKAGKRLLRGYTRKRLTGTLRLRVTYRPASGAAPQRRVFRQPVRLRVVKPKPRR